MTKAFSPRTISPLAPWSKCYASSSRLGATISWLGDSKASIELPDYNNDDTIDYSIQDWLQSSDSDFHLLGTTNASPRSCGELWDCRQPRIQFLGLDLVPIFVNRLERTTSSVTVTIVDAQTEIGNSGKRNRAVAKIMQNSKFLGESKIVAMENTLSVDLTLTLQVKLPPFLPLPPGFNTLGSAMIRRTGKSRVQQLLRDLNQAYEEWVAAQLQEPQKQQQ